MEQKMLEKIKKTARNSAFIVGTIETKEKKYNDYEEKEKDFFVLGEKLAKDIFVEQVLAETNYNKNELKEFILENKDVFKTDNEELENLSYKDMVKIVKNSSNEIIDFKNDVEPLFDRAFAFSEENTINECKQDYFESLGRKKLLPILLKKVEENVEHFKNVKDFRIDDVDNEFGREDDYYQFRDKLMKDVSNEFYDTFVTSVYNFDYKTDREDKREEKEKLIKFFEVNPLLADDFFKFISSNKIDENLFDELYDKLEDVMDKTVNQKDGEQIQFISPYEIDKNGKLSFDINEKNFDEKDKNVEDKLKKLNNRIAENIAKELKYNDYSHLMTDTVKRELRTEFLAETTNVDTKEKDLKFMKKYELKDEIDERVKTRYSLNPYESTEFKAFITDENIQDKISDKIVDFYKKNKDIDKETLVKKINDFLDESNIFDKAIEINDKKLRKAEDFENNITLIEKNLKEYGKENGTIYSGKIVQLNGEKGIGLTIINKETEKEEKTLVAKSLNEFKQKVIDFIGEDIENKKDYYFKNMKYDIYKERKDNLERLEEKVDFNKTDIKTDKDFSFEFTDKNKENYKYDYKLVIADKENKYKSMYKYTNYRKISMALVDENFSDYFTTTSNGALENHYLKIDYLKEKNKDIMKQINENIEKESFSMAKADMILMAVSETKSKRAKIGEKREFSELMSESIDTSFFNRIGNLKEKESFVEKNADELGLTLNEDGKIEELYDENSEKYKENIDDFLKAVKENLKEEVIGNYEKPDYLKEYSKLKPETLTLQKEFYKNAFPILLSEDDMKLSKSKINNLDGISNSKKEKLKERINDYFNSMSEHSKDIENPYQFKERCENFSTKYYDFDKSFDIELPTEKNNKKEISKNKEKEKEKTDEKEIEF